MAAPLPTHANISWPAPAPFRSLVGTSHKAQLTRVSQLDRMTDLLEALSLSGRTTGTGESKIPRLNSMIEALNAYNAREPNRRRRAWGWVEPKVLNIPHRSEDITGDPTYDPSSTGPGDNHNIFEDFSEQWPSLVTWPRRPIQTSPGCVKYRLAFFIHKHPPREHDAVDRNLNTSYSVSIWDRENNELCWHDPWPYHRSRRRRNITQYWTDCQTGWRNNGVSNVDFAAILQIHNRYRALAHLQGCSYRSMEPRFSYWAVVGIILWCMNNIDSPALLRPPDTEEVFSGMHTLPAFYVHTFMTLYENSFRAYWATGSRAAHIDIIRDRFRIEHNRYLAEEVHRLFTPFLVANGGPLPRWAARAVTGI